MKNRFKIQGEITSIYLPTPKLIKVSKSFVLLFIEAIIDTNDLERVMEFPEYWTGNDNYKPYVTGTKSNERLHRWIMEPPKGMVVDHINHDTFDNRRCNLRICTSCENTRNKKLSVRNKTGVTGVIPSGKKWVASIGVNMKPIYLGTFSTIEDATRARKEAEIKYFGEFRYQA